MTEKIIPDMKLRKFVVGRTETSMSLVSCMYRDKEELKGWVDAYMEKFDPTHLKIVRKMAVKDTPDGPMRTPILVWRARWIHGQTRRVVLFRPISPH